MSNRRTPRRRTRRDPYGLDDRKPPDAYTSAELHRMLVADGVNRWIGGRQELAYLNWLTAACIRIGRVDGCGPEEAFVRVNLEVVELTGRPLRVQ